MFRPVGIRPVNHGISLPGSDLPEASVGIVSGLPHSQQIHFQGNIPLFAKTAQGGHLFLVDGGISVVIDEVRMREIQEFPGLKPFPALAAVEHQVFRSVSRLSVVAVSLIFIADKVLSQKQVFDGIGFDQAQIGLPEFRIVFRLQTQMYLNVIPVLPAQTENCVHIVLQL